MNLMSWNCRGLGNPRTIRELRHLIQTQNTSFIFLCETKCPKKIIEEIKVSLGFFGIAVSPKKKKGGIAFLWKKDSDVWVRGFSDRFIDAVVYDKENGNWRITGIYGHPEVNKRAESWKMICSLSTNSSLPWCILGDFNEILRQDECWGGRPRPHWQIERFRMAVDDAGLIDLTPHGYVFTWSRNWRKWESYKARLDRALINNEFMRIWPHTRLFNIDANCSDHLPIVLKMRKDFCFSQERGRQRKSKRFKFEAMWSTRNEVKSIIQKMWVQRMPVDAKLELCKKELSKWSKTSFGNIHKETDRLRSRIAELKFSETGYQNDGELERLQEELEERLDQQDIMWKQRSKDLWLKNGDRNTAYFHSKASQKFKKNRVEKLMNGDGRWVEDEMEIRDMIVTYYQKLFSSESPPKEHILAVVSRIGNGLSNDMRDIVASEFTRDEVKRALFAMQPLKSPGPDGFPPVFYQKYWTIVGHDVETLILHMLKDGRLVSNVNATTIVLIPKVPHPKELSQLRPISLCNVIYRIMTKMVANRLKSVLPNLISHSQSAFISKRLITDNVLIAHEMHNLIKRRRKGLKGLMSIKLDMSKAFDRVEWGFLIDVLRSFGFDESFINTIHSCISSVKFSFTLNGESFGSVVPSRGLRQGDPISPYLFLLCTEVLSRLLQDAVICKSIKGIRAGRDGPIISHLMFADDTVLFGEATKEEAYAFSKVLDLYCRVLGQRINKDKSGIYFSPNVPQQVRQSICNILGFCEVSKHEKYLGLPAVTGRSKKQLFSSIRERIVNKISGWEEKLLSRAGKEVLIKAVIQAIPTYAMSVFKVPDNVLNDIQSKIQKFWWCSNGKSSGVHWIAWDNLCNSKNIGGLGLRDMKAFNMALLVKHAWKILTEPNSLLYKVYMNLYFRNKSFLEASATARASYSWRSIIEARNILAEGLKWRVGNGDTIRIYKDKWLSGKDPRRLYPLSFCSMQNSNEDARVSELINKVHKKWDEEKIFSIFDDNDAHDILKVPIGDLSVPDIPMWPYTKNGCLSVKSAYHFIVQSKRKSKPCCSSSKQEGNGRPWRKLWSLNIANKVKMFVWRLCWNSLPCYENLVKRKIDAENFCFVCGAQDGGLIHLFARCPLAIQMWALSHLWSILRPEEVVSVHEWVFSILTKADNEEVEKFMVILGFIWKHRNEAHFEAAKTEPMKLWQVALSFWNEYRMANAKEVLEIQRSDESTWTPPMPGYVKINTDAAVTTNGNGAIGWVMHDATGQFKGAVAQPMRLCDDVEVLEALAIKGACEWCLEKDIDHFIVESDSLYVVNMFLDHSENRMAASLFVEESKAMLEGKDWTIRWISRKRNEVAHSIACFAKKCTERVQWLEDPPDFILPALLADCTGCNTCVL